MSYLVDTNVLLRSIQASNPSHSDAAKAIASLMRQGQELSITAQNLIEFWAVATRSTEHNGLGLSIDESAQHLTAFRVRFLLLTDNNDIFEKWEQMVRQHQVIGKQVYDARLVAAMIVHNVTHLLTFNTADFKRFTSITAVNPQSFPNQ
jgi:predicted nucleic acid-binding protein